jgi:hypothetical protein
MVGRTTTAIQPTSTGPTKVDSVRDIALVRSKIRNNSANTPKRGLKLYRLNSAKNTTTIRPVTSTLLTWQISKHSQRAIVRAEQTMQRQLACHLATSIPRATTLRANGDSVSLEAIRSPAFKNGRCMAALEQSGPPLGFSAFFNSKNLRFCHNCTEMIL